LTIPEFIKLIHDRMGLNPKQAMEKLKVKSLNGLNLRDALERLERMAEQQPSGPNRVYASDAIVAPTQYEPTPPPVPTQLASVSTLPETSPPAPSSSPQERPITQSPQQQLRQTTGNSVVQQPSQPAEEKVKVWNIGKRQIIAMCIGIILHASLFSVSPTFFGYNLLLRFTVPVFFGVVFGPWVGLVVGGIGEVVGQVLFGRFLWVIMVGAASTGLISGLSMLKTQGQYTFGNAVLAGVIGTAGLAIGIGFILATLNIFGLFATDTLGDAIITLIIFPVLLLIYDKIANRKKA
jgi:energy-coupling factor transport system substrate-specific component